METVNTPLIEREFPEADIFEKLDLGDNKINEELSELQRDLKSKLKNRADVAGQCKAYNKLGTAYHHLFMFDKAEICHNLHLELSNPLQLTLIPVQHKKTIDPKEKKCALVNLGCVYHAKREYELAVQTFKEALLISEEVPIIIYSL